MTIQSWKSRQAEAVFYGRDPGKGFPADLVKATRRRLQRLDAVAVVEDLRAPPSHRLHALGGDREGEWSISVNDQFRITFKWGPSGPEEVWFGDYHGLSDHQSDLGDAQPFKPEGEDKRP